MDSFARKLKCLIESSLNIRYLDCDLLSILKKSMDKASIETNVQNLIFTPQLNLIRCFLLLLKETVPNFQYIFARIIYSLGWEFEKYIKEYDSIIEYYKDIKKKIGMVHKLKPKLFCVFRIDVNMMESSLLHIEKKIDDILDIWDIDFKIPYYNIPYFNYDCYEIIILSLLTDNDVYGMLAMEQLTSCNSINRLKINYKKSIMDIRSWEIITRDSDIILYHHDLLPHPDHFIKISQDVSNKDSYLKKAAFPFEISTEDIKIKFTKDLIECTENKRILNRKNNHFPIKNFQIIGSLEKISETCPRQSFRPKRKDNGAFKRNNKSRYYSKINKIKKLDRTRERKYKGDH